MSVVVPATVYTDCFISPVFYAYLSEFLSDQALRWLLYLVCTRDG